ncbi:hypothetical protein N7461_007129 [Penicillium sp. DV-2018c]|nr:hypothetical protein N7461_007129 [Penicillium sp. DV-2018c]
MDVFNKNEILRVKAIALSRTPKNRNEVQAPSPSGQDQSRESPNSPSSSPALTTGSSSSSSFTTATYQPPTLHNLLGFNLVPWNANDRGCSLKDLLVRLSDRS